MSAYEQGMQIVDDIEVMLAGHNISFKQASFILYEAKQRIERNWLPQSRGRTITKFPATTPTARGGITMTDTQKTAYDATLQRLYRDFPENPAPYISQVANYLKCESYALTKHRDFRDLTFGNKRRRITLENLALWQCKI